MRFVPITLGWLFLVSCGAPPPIPGGVWITAGGGVVEEEGARFVFPPGSVNDREAARVERVDLLYVPLDLNQHRIAETWELNRWPVEIRRPVTVRLPYHPEWIPEGASSEQVYAVFGTDTAWERIEIDRIDAEKREVEFRLDHARPRAAACSLQDADGLFVTVALDREPTEVILWGPENEYKIVTLRRLIEQARPTAAVVGPLVGKIRAALASRGYAVPEFVCVTLVPMRSDVGGQAANGRDLYVNLDMAMGDQERLSHVLSHEMFHLVQQNSLRRFDSDPKHPDDAGWLQESTAEAVATSLYPAGASQLRGIDSAFWFRGLFTYESVGENLLGKSPPQYLSLIFWSYLADLYDADEILKQIYVPRGSPLAKRILSEKIFLRDLLDRILSQTEDEKGRMLSLWQVYVNFLLHGYWKKDFEPWKDNFDPEKVGKAGVIRSPRDHLEVWNLPITQDGKRMTRRWATFAGEAFCIVQAVRISSKPLSHEKGDLELRLDVGKSGNGERTLMVVFPFKKKLENPLFAVPGDPLVIRSWETYEGVLVWLVDASPVGRNDLMLTAEMLMERAEEAPPVASPLEGDWLGTSTVTESDSRRSRVGKSGQANIRLRRDIGGKLKLEWLRAGEWWEEYPEAPSIVVYEEGGGVVIEKQDFGKSTRRIMLTRVGENRMEGEGRSVDVNSREETTTVVWTLDLKRR